MKQPGRPGPGGPQFSRPQRRYESGRGLPHSPANAGQAHYRQRPDCPKVLECGCPLPLSDRWETRRLSVVSAESGREGERFSFWIGEHFGPGLRGSEKNFIGCPRPAQLDTTQICEPQRHGGTENYKIHGLTRPRISPETNGRVFRSTHRFSVSVALCLCGYPR